MKSRLNPSTNTIPLIPGASHNSVPSRLKEIKAGRLPPPLPSRPANNPSQRDQSNPSQLTFAPLAWLKLLTLLHADDVEVGGFGISQKADLLYVSDIAVPLQRVSPVTVCFDDTAVAEHFEACADRGISPARCGRIWIHTHPGSSAQPSSVDERTFERAFGSSDWAAMVIVAKEGQSYCRLRFSAGPGGQVVIPVCVDWAALPQALVDQEGTLDALTASWLDEYGRNVHPAAFERWMEPFNLFEERAESPPRDHIPASLWPDGPAGDRDDPFAGMGRVHHEVPQDPDELFLRYVEDRLEDAFTDGFYDPAESTTAEYTTAEYTTAGMDEEGWR